MKKIPTLFTRTEDGLVRDDVDPRADKVVAGRCIATAKLDGSCCLYYGSALWKRRMVHVERPEGEGDIVQVVVLPAPDGAAEVTEMVKPVNLPEGFLAASDVIWKDENAGVIPGWVPVGDGPEDQYHREALANRSSAPVDGGTFELCGPKVQGNPQKLVGHELIQHGTLRLMNAPTDFGGIKEFLNDFPDYEGIVWWFGDEPYAKVKRRDFGLDWPVKEAT